MFWTYVITKRKQSSKLVLQCCFFQGTWVSDLVTEQRFCSMKLKSANMTAICRVTTPPNGLWLTLFFAAQNRQKIKQGRRTLPVLNSIPWNTFRLCRQRKAMDTLRNISLFVLLVPFSCFHTRDYMVSCLKHYWVNLQYANESPITYWQWVPMTVGPIVSHADIGVTTLASENILVKTEWLPESWLLQWKVLKSVFDWGKAWRWKK